MTHDPVSRDPVPPDPVPPGSDPDAPGSTGPDYLWDARGPVDGPVDGDVERLERLLRPLGHDATRATRAPAGRRVAVRRIAWAVALSACLSACLLVLVWWTQRGPALPPAPVVPAPAAPAAPGPVLLALGPDQPVGEAAWVETHESARELRLGDVGELTLGAGSRLEVRRLSAEETRLYLERGRLSALVSADAQPRFFQVDTPATRCVDLGCRYTLEVDARGDAQVEVQTGRVAFENGEREVLVPRGARCRATRLQGAGTPRFLDAAPALAQAADAFDAAAGGDAARRRELAAALLAAVQDRRDCLVAWHVLQDADPEIARQAQERLLDVVGPLPSRAIDPRLAPGVGDRAAWRVELEPSWW